MDFIISPAFIIYLLGVAWLCANAENKRNYIGNEDCNKMYVISLGWPIIFSIYMIAKLITDK